MISGDSLLCRSDVEPALTAISARVRQKPLEER
jgi:hypothetical protein